MASLFFSYSHKDEALRDQLEVQLTMLKRQGVIDAWHDRRIGAGEDFATAIDAHVEGDDIILLLVSPDFLASDYCYEKEMQQAMERHAAGQAVVIPVILRPCEWTQAPFGKLNATPPDGRAVTQFPNRDEAFLSVTQAIRKAAERVNAGTAEAPAKPIGAHRHVEPARSILMPPAGPRSSNLALAKRFTERERDAFKEATFEYIANYFENSLAELIARNAGVDGTFRRVDANRFTAVIYKDGKAMARCAIFMGGRSFGGDIGYSASDTATNSYNELLSVEADDQALYLASLGMQSMGRRTDKEKLSQEGAAELYWSMLIQPLQPR